MIKNKSLFAGLAFLLISSSGLTSCFTVNPNTVSKDSSKSTGKIVEIGKGQKGANISLKINVGKKESFKIKDSEHGVAGATLEDIDHFVVYLITDTNANGYNPVGDPVGGAVASFEIDNASTSVTFTNVPGSGEDYYYVAVRAVDNEDNDLIKENESWTGTTQTDFEGRVAVSGGDGVKVDDNYQIIDGPLTDLIVEINLNESVGATVGSSLIVIDGDALPESTVSASPEAE